MKIKNISAKNISFGFRKTIDYEKHKTTSGEDEKEEKLSKILSYYLQTPICYNKVNYPIKNEQIEQLQIPNIKIIANNNVRGETLSSKKNRWAIRKIKEYGIENVIDLRDKYTSEKYPLMCLEAGLGYYNFPIDSNEIDDRVIIKNFMPMFDLLNKGRCYISCAQGLHRTDIALALNYVFNPKNNEIPQMYGHLYSDMTLDDVITRINSIYRKMPDEQLRNLGWKCDARSTILERKESLKESFLEDKENFIPAEVITITANENIPHINKKSVS